ncbi:MAG: hypothetical protein L6R40_008009 [Gallowayella cf. fulva]|nr:MAG: hypothetical protein L6R40_008009 [Xanthomendoza cf. fulva]
MRIPLHVLGLACLALQGTHAEVLQKWKDITSDKDIQLEQSGASSLIKSLDDALPNVSVDQVVADANHEMTVKGGKYKWPATKDDNEFDSESWFPQGISSSVDAGDAKYNKNHLFLVSWYAKKDKEKGVRITFVNTSVSPPKYRQVLLVEPTGTTAKPSFKTVGLHAGGIAWYGNILYVADTNQGVRLFDLDHIYRVKDGDGAGRQSDGSYHAYGYKYVLPQVRRYKTHGDPKDHDYTYSCLALDRTSNPASIVFGEYYHADKGDHSRVARFDLDSTTKLLKVNKDNVATASKVFLHGEHRVQGAITVNGRYFLSQSNGDEDSDIIGFTPGDKSSKQYRILPPGSEDLTYDKAADTLWTLTEHPGERYIVGTPISEIS